ncbi:hypothetical protein SDC9_86720 [bioreactor metagenome]|uniref:Uncharacterized protein n=1 Tax=bioreactor metagenome TaxID=1076179 RepID=A0A644ZGQ7_9ZZZZ
MPVNRAEIEKPHVFKQAFGHEKALDAVFKVFHIARKPAAEDACVKRAHQSALKADIPLAGAHVDEHTVQRTDILGNRHLVVVENHDQRHVGLPRVVKPLKRQPARECAVADKGNCRAFLAEQLFRARHAERGGDCRRGMPRIKRVVLALLTFGKTRKTVLLSKGTKRLPATRDDLMRIGLMSHVKNNLVGRAVKRAMHGDDELHRAKARCEMPAAARYIFNHILANLRRQSGQFTILEMLKILKGINLVESRVTIHVFVSFFYVYDISVQLIKS